MNSTASRTDPSLRIGPVVVDAGGRSVSRQLTVFAGLAIICLLPVLGKFTLGDIRTNLLSGVALLIFACVLGLRFDTRWLRAPQRHVLGACLVAAGIVIAAWQWQVGDLWLNGQLVLYAGIVAAGIAFVGWLRDSETGAAAIELIFELKLGAVIAASFLLFIAVARLPDDPGAISAIIRDAPIYLHLRHFNNDQMPAIAIAVYFASQAAGSRSRLGWFVLLAVMGYLLAWSGARAAILSLGTFFVVVAAFRVLPRRAIVVWGGALAVGALLVFASGRADELLIKQIARYSGEGLSSGRFEIWGSSLLVWSRSWLSILFGFGPDAIRTFIRTQIGSPPIFQIHNGPLQVLLEFGIIGLTAFLAGLALIARRVIRILSTPLAPEAAKVASALLIALGVYMLFSGIIYHAVPFSFTMFLTAYLFHFDLDNLESQAHADTAETSPQRSRSANTMRNMLPPSARA